ncbi:MAG: ABC transporter substrate-binding protein [Sphingomonadales bacterium]|nr:ABC transporter substrate-binding protein [Sphingomonadales bacterium]
MKFLRSGILLFGALCLVSCDNQQKNPQTDPQTMSWQEIEQSADGTTVQMLTWMGDAAINNYMTNYVAPTLLERYDIKLEMASVAGPRIVSFIMAEREAGKTVSEADMVWMAGRTSYQLRQLGELYGPFTDKLPSSQYINYQDPYIGWDYEIPLTGLQAPWGMGQFLLISDSARVANPPRNMAELEAWVKSNPGRFTLDAGFTTLAFLKALLVEVAGGRDVFSGGFHQDVYLEHSQKVWNYLNRIRPYMWRDGKAFPRSPAQMHQMFANGELDFTMSYNDGEADGKIASGLFADTVYGFSWEHGTPKNTHYLAIVKNAPNKAGAMVVINFLQSAEAQLEKLTSTWGDGSILDFKTLPSEQEQQFLTASTRHHAPKLADIEDRAFLELRPEYINKLYTDYLENFIRKGRVND